jgi:hypothetical protein
MSESQKMIYESAVAWDNVERLVKKAKRVLPAKEYRDMRQSVREYATTSRRHVKRARDATTDPGNGDTSAEEALDSILQALEEDTQVFEDEEE